MRNVILVLALVTGLAVLAGAPDAGAFCTTATVVAYDGGNEWG